MAKVKAKPKVNKPQRQPLYEDSVDYRIANFMFDDSGFCNPMSSKIADEDEEE